jgi:hypothetical protein
LAERVLSNDLSGDEICIAAGDMLTQMLRRDCRLQPGNAYRKFTLEMTGTLIAEDVGHVPEIPITLIMRTQQPPAEDIEALDLELDISEAPPNQVRVETGQAVPVETRDAEGKTMVKGVTYKRKPHGKK